MAVDEDRFGVLVSNPVAFGSMVKRDSVRLEPLAGHKLSVCFIGGGVFESGIMVRIYCLGLCHWSGMERTADSVG